MSDENHTLTWLHIGDLHITRAGTDNHPDLLRPAKGLPDTHRGPNRNGQEW